MDVRPRSLVTDKKNYKNDKKFVNEILSPWVKDTLATNPSASNNNWNLLANRLAKLEDQLSKLDAEANIGDHLRPRQSGRASGSTSSKRQSDSSNEASKRSSKASSPSQSSRSHSRSCSPNIRYYGSMGTMNTTERAGKDMHEPEGKEEKKGNTTTGAGNRLRASGKRSTAVLKYFADIADERKPENSRPTNSSSINKHAVKSAVIENFSDGKTPQYKASRDSLTKENIKKFVTPKKEKQYQRLLTNRDSMFPRATQKNQTKYEERNCEKSSKLRNEDTNQPDLTPPFSNLQTTSEVQRKSDISFSTKNQKEPLYEAESRLETTVSKISKGSPHNVKKVKGKKDDNKSNKPLKLQKKKSKIYKSELNIKKKDGLKIKPKVAVKPKKTPSIKTPEKKEETKKNANSAKVGPKNSPKPLSKRGSSVSKIGSSPRMTPSSSLGSTFSKEITKRGAVTPKTVYCALTSKPNCLPGLFKSNFGSLSPRINFGSPTPRSGSECSAFAPNDQEESPKPTCGVSSSRTSYNRFQFEPKNQQNEVMKTDSFSRRPPSNTVFRKNERKKSERVTLLDKNSITSENASKILAPKTRHLTDMEVQILVKDVEQISGQIQKYIRKWDEVLKTNTSADRDEDIRKTVLSACVLLDTKLKRAKELLMKYKALTSGNNGLGSPTAEMLEALLYYQLTQLDVASVIKTFRRLDSMLTSGK